MTMVSNSQSADPEHVEAQATRKAASLFFLLTLTFWIVSALSRLTELERQGVEVSWDIPWLMEGSSLLITALLFFFVARVERRFPIGPGGSLSKAVAHILASAIFSAAHIVAMVWIREIYFWLIHSTEYVYLRNPIQDVLYDYRKDLVTYVTILILIYLARSFELARVDAASALQGARQERRLLLKCGGRSVFVDASDVEAVQADGNYVHVHTPNQSYHARMTLTDAADLLSSAGYPVSRVHKSWLVKADQVSAVSKTEKGDPVYALKSGRQIRGSRRYSLEAGIAR